MTRVQTHLYLVVSMVLAATAIVSGCSVSGNGTGNGTGSASHATNAASHQTSNTAASNRTTPEGGQVSSQNAITLESVQVAKNGILLLMTHGDMQSVYRNPRIQNGTFSVTLVNVKVSPSIVIGKSYTLSLIHI